MERKYSEDDVTWSSIEKYIPYAKVEWSINKQGISTYKLIDKNGKEIDIGQLPLTKGRGLPQSH